MQAACESKQPYLSNLTAPCWSRISCEVLSSTNVSGCPVYFPIRCSSGRLRGRDRAHTSDAIDFSADHHTDVSQLALHHAAPLYIRVHISGPPRWIPTLRRPRLRPRRRHRRAVRLECISVIHHHPLPLRHFIPCAHQRLQQSRHRRGLLVPQLLLRQVFFKVHCTPNAHNVEA